MKIATFELNNTISYGIVVEDGLIEASTALRSRYATVRDLLDADGLQLLADDVAGRSAEIPLTAINLLPPIHNPQRIICVGINYPKRYPIDNTIMPPPENIILFARLDGTLVGHETPLEIPVGDAAKTFDYEGEIVAIIGKAGRHIAVEDALDYVAGYTIMNDGSVRGWQKHSVHAGKNFANSGACGPWMVSAETLPNPSAFHLQTVLNGETVQDTLGDAMVFSIPEVISYISHTLDLRPGDLIATGSPEGSGGSRQPQRFLRKGDELEISVSGIGTLRNRVG